jgi:hypothetical protein
MTVASAAIGRTRPDSLAVRRREMARAPARLASSMFSEDANLPDLRIARAIKSRTSPIAARSPSSTAAQSPYGPRSPVPSRSIVLRASFPLTP